MARISSVFFMISLLVYYVGKLLNKKKKRYVSFHIITGFISVFVMLLASITTLGQTDFLKYAIFAIIMLGIGITGYLTYKVNMKYKKIHINTMVVFFIYLALIIIF